MTASHSHDHHGHLAHDRSGTDAKALRFALGLIVAFMVGEVIVAFAAHSLALLADAGHMLTDAAALAVALWAISLAARPATTTWSFGLKRAEILAAAVNGITLVAVGCVVLVESIQRLRHPTKVGGTAVLVVAITGILVNVLATIALSRANRASMNVEGAFQHIATDAAGFVATAIAAVVIMTTGFRRADAIASLVIVGLIAYAAWTLLKSAVRVLLEGVPEGVDLNAVRQHLIEADSHVHDVHDLHAWVVTSDLPAMSAHVVIDDSCFVDGHAPQILDVLQAALIGNYDVEHSTLQLEPASHAGHEMGAH